MDFSILMLPGDGIGPEVARQGTIILERVGQEFDHKFNIDFDEIGGVAIDKLGTALPESALSKSKSSDAVFLAAVGGPKWDKPGADIRPEDGLLALRKGLNLFSNMRPVRTYPELINSSPLKREIMKDVDLLVIRELTGGLYFGKPKRRWETKSGRKAVDTMSYSEKEISRILKVGFEAAMRRSKRLTSVDKANVLATSRLWRDIAIELAPEYPDVELEHMLVDTCSMRIVDDPSHFDVIVTENTFGDILTDEASVLAGSMGMLPSASLAGIPSEQKRTFGLYEPIHGSAPDIAGQNKANPIGTILSIAMMLRHSLGLSEEAKAVESAVQDTIREGYRTADIATSTEKAIGTDELGRIIASRI